jgi:polysaccharide biosynthesis protein PslH
VAQERSPREQFDTRPEEIDGMEEAVADQAAEFSRPLAGKIVAIVHPAWHSCGSHGVFVAQARAYKSLGATTVSLALADTPGCVDGSRASRGYLAQTADLEACLRGFAGVPLCTLWTREFLSAVKKWMHGNYAATWIEAARLAAIPQSLTAPPRIDLIHCNHFFCMPAATRLRARHGCPILLDTHDLQARQYALRNRAGFWLPPVASYQEMLAAELDAMRPADVLIHLNAEEAAAFQELLPTKRHALLYPAVAAMPAGAAGGESIIVASANYPNFLGLRWFLQEVLPLVPELAVKIYGNIDRMFCWRAPLLFKKHSHLFKGRVENDKLCDAYRQAAAVLLPATAGHGISIKTIEALSCGAPLIAAPLAFRGFPHGAANLSNVTIVKDAAGFVAALRSAHAQRHMPGLDRQSSPTRRFYEKHFAFAAYCRSLLTIADEVMEKASGEG